MALALLTYQTSNTESLIFRGDIGTNQFYVFALGQIGDINTEGGVPILKQPYYTAAIRKLPEEALGRLELVIDKHLMKGDKVFIQLFSFKSEQGKGMAFSDILQIKNRKNESRRNLITQD